ncbi:MAG: tubulin-like doman-containing protein, partial [Armatimonadota bacterium]
MASGPPVEQPQGMKRSIIIGLGGTGMEVVMRLRGQLLEHYRDFDDIPIVRFLVIDTDTGYELTERSLIRPSTQLGEDERIDAIVADPRPIYTGIERGAHPYIGEWFSLEQLRGITNIQDGAGQVRQLGRLCLYHKYNEIKARLIKIRESLTMVDCADYMREHHDVEIDPGVNIYIVGSLAGGTGGGMFLDMAYIVKHLFPTSNAQPRRVVGYLIMPQAFAGLGDRIEANGYASLKELNYHSYTGDPTDRQFPLFGRPRFQAQYSESDADRIGDEGLEPPFDYTYLVSNSTAQGIKLKRSEIFEMVARNLMLDFTSKFAQWKRSLRDNIRPVTLHPDALGCPVRYMTFGLSSIYFPVERVRQACAYHLAVTLASRWRQEIEDPEAIRATSDAINNYIETFLDELEMVESVAHRRHQLIGPICLSQTGQPLQNVANEWKAYVASLPDQQQWDFRVWFDRLAEEEQRFRRRFDDSNPNPEGWGPYFRRMYDNMVQQTEQRKKQLSAAIADMVEDEHRGPKYAELFIDQLCAKFEDYKTELDRTAKSAQAIANYLGDVNVQGAVQGSGISLDNLIAQAMEQNLHEVRKVASSPLYILNRKEAMRRQMMEYLGWASSYFRAKVEIKARYLGRDLLDGLIAHLHDIRRAVLDLRTFLRQLCDHLEAIEDEYLQTTDVIVVNGELIYSRELVNSLYREFVPEGEERNTLMQLLDRVLSDEAIVEPGQRLRLIDIPARAKRDLEFLETLRKT